jgi:probable O-glycosylation ligase (exosortase A-associated)
MRDLGLASAVLALLGISASGRPFVGILAWSWISFMNPHQEAYGFARTMPLAMLAFIATVIGCVVAKEPKRPAVNAVTVLLTMLAFWVTLTSFTALAPPGPVWWKWDRTVKMIAGLILTAAMLTNQHRVNAMVWLLAISLGYYGLKGGIFTIVTGGAFRVVGPDSSLIADRNHIAVGLLVALPLMNWLRLQARHAIVRHVMAITMLFTLLAAVGTQSRGALISLVAVAGVLWLRSRGKVLSGIAIALAMVGAIAFMPDSWVERMRTIQDYDADASAMGRIWIWWAAWQIALSRPLLGGGFRAVYQQDIVNRFDPSIPARADHSIWFEALSEQGFLGFAIWLGILLAGTAYSFSITRQTRNRPDLGWAQDLARMSQVSITAYVTGGSFLSLAYWDYFWTILVVLGATRKLVAEATREASTYPFAQPRRWQSTSAAVPVRVASQRN